MIELDDDESMLLLITKNWEHKDVKKLEKESKTDYIERVCKFRCYGDANAKWKADVFSIYANLAEKILSPKQLINCMRYIEPSLEPWTLTRDQAIISAISILQIKSDKEIFIKLNYDLIEPKALQGFLEETK